MLDASVAAVFQVSLATGLTGGGAVTPINMNATAANVATFTVLSSNTGALSGASRFLTIDIPAAQAYPFVDWTNNPVILPAGSATGFGIGTTAGITGNIRISVLVQEYPY